jgi:hypothetical protein
LCVALVVLPDFVVSVSLAIAGLLGFTDNNRLICPVVTVYPIVAGVLNVASLALMYVVVVLRPRPTHSEEDGVEGTPVPLFHDEITSVLEKGNPEMSPASPLIDNAM